MSHTLVKIKFCSVLVTALEKSVGVRTKTLGSHTGFKGQLFYTPSI